MNLDARIKAFAALGEKIEHLPDAELEQLKAVAHAKNPWFIPEFVEIALQGIVHFLKEENLKAWTGQYKDPDNSKTVGIVMAGNIPAVGFHDMLCVLISGHTAMLKLSSKDEFLIKTLLQWLTEIEPGFKEYIRVAERLNDAEAVIATGSDNTARYFRYYFDKKPHIIRQNRTAVAVLDGQESVEAIHGLISDIMLYFGLGCRNVSKIYVPKDYDFKAFLDKVNESKYAGLIDTTKYRNNYDYNKSIYLVNGEPHLDSGVLLVRESKELVSPTAVIYYQVYENEAQMQLILAEHQEKIQCVVSQCTWLDQAVAPGKAQLPDLDNYADGIDTMEFLAQLH